MWEVILRGDKTALSTLCAASTDSDVKVVEREGEFILRRTAWGELDGAKQVLLDAAEWAPVLAGTARLILDWACTIELGGACHTGPDGRRETVLHAEPGSIRVEARPAILRVTRADGSEKLKRPGEQAVHWLDVAAANQAVARALRLYADPDLSWVELYRIMEVIEADAGAKMHDWISRKQLKLFKRTANSVGAVGDNARHGAEATAPPPNPMTLGTAKSLIKGLLHKWLERV